MYSNSNITITEERMCKLLETASPLVKRHNPLEDINLFTILGMETKEVSAHSAFLYYIFKPFQSNGTERDDLNLRILYRHLFKNTDYTPGFLDIQREVVFDGGRLDFLLKFDSDAAVIELKVWAGEQPYQIQRYREFLKQNGYSEDNVFFLTPSGWAAESGEAKTISLKKDMKDVLNDICDKRNGYEQYTAIIMQYISLIEKLTGDSGTDMCNVSDIYKSKKDILASIELDKLRNVVLTSILRRFMDDLKAELVKNGKLNGTDFPCVVLDEESNKKWSIGNYYDRGIKSYPAIVFALDKERFIFPSKLKDNEYLFFYVEIEHKLYCGITTRTDDYEPIIPEGKYEGCTVSPYNELHVFEGGYWSWEHIKYNNLCIDFHDYDAEDGVLSILKEDENSIAFLDKCIGEIATAVLNSFKKQYALFFHAYENQ